MCKNRRSELEIIGNILLLSQNGVRKTEILYKVNLSYHQLQKYLAHLLHTDILIEKNVHNGGPKKGKIYQTTPKGVDFLKEIIKTMDYFS